MLKQLVLSNRSIVNQFRYNLAARFSTFSLRMEEALKGQEELKEQVKVIKANVKKQKYDGRLKRRQWEEKRNETQEKRICLENGERVKRKKAVVLLGYSGVNYFGMQRNPDMHTLEEVLLKAMLKNNWINEEGYSQPQQIQFQRAARTDKGVSAERQVVSLKLPESVDVAALNKDLPDDIRVFCIKRVTKGFNSKSSCDARTYSYTFPTFAIASETELVEKGTDFRMSDEMHTKLNDILKMYVGTKNFHNFTCRKDYGDPSSKRFIMSFDCSKPFVPNDCKLEFARIKIKGQSFMMHQIRKMVGLTFAVMRGNTGPETINRALTQDRLDIPMAPGLGLVLNEIHYTRYAERYGDDGIHDRLTFEDEKEEIEKFFEAKILPTIISTEISDNSMLNWLETLSLHSYDIRTEPRDKSNPSELETDE